MVPAKVTNQAWIDTITYNALVANAITGGTPDASPDTAKPSPRVAVIQGIFSREGDRLLTFKPVFRYPWASQPTSRPRDAPSNYVAEVTLEGGEVIRAQFDALQFEDGERKGGPFRGFFEVMVPVDPNREIVSVRITDLQGQREFGSVRRSQPPTINIVSPQPGGALGERTEVSWEAKDPDTPPDQLMFQVAYSPDGGRTWVPVAVDVRGRSATFDSTEIQGSDGSGAIRVFVSDGLNTAVAEVGKLSTRAAKYKGYDPAGRIVGTK